MVVQPSKCLQQKDNYGREAITRTRNTEEDSGLLRLN